MDNYFTNIYKRKDKVQHVGHDYSKTLLKDTLSEELYNSNIFLVGFLDHINDILVSLVDSVKHIKTTANIALDKNEKNII